MVQRLISANASEIKQMSKEELFQGIKTSKGHAVLLENVVVHPSAVGDIICAEMSRTCGADMTLLNVFDVNQPIVAAAYEGQYIAETCAPNDGVIHHLKELVGLPIGMNVEPVSENLDLAPIRVPIEPGRKISAAAFKKASVPGLDFILLTGNPGTGMTNNLIARNVALVEKHSDDIIIAGRIHSSGVGGPVVSLKLTEQFIRVGADTVLIPAVGAVWGIIDQQVKEVVDFTHSKGKLVMSATGASQKNAQPEAIQTIGIRNKILGVGIQHIGDTGISLVGIENVKELPDVIRGKRHTITRMTHSISR